MRNAVRKLSLYLRFQFPVKHVRFGYGQDTPLDQKFRVVFLEFVQEYPVSLAYVIGVRRNHEKKD